jgi:hypothetical protein
MHHVLDLAFPARTVNTVALRSFAFVSHTIRTLEEELEKQRTERDILYADLLENPSFRGKIRIVLPHYRLMTRAGRRVRFNPYKLRSSTPGAPSTSTAPLPPYPTHPSPQPSLSKPQPSKNAVASSSRRSDSVVISLEDALVPPPSSAGSSGSFYTAPEGTRQDPIIVEDDDDLCDRCKQPGHHIDDCNTKMRIPGECRRCKWTNQKECDHWSITPAWIKLQKAKFNV